MSDAEIPEADALEQSATVDADLSGDGAPARSSDPEAPEADALEQSAIVRGGGRSVPPSVGIEVPEADAQEQAAAVGEDDER